MLRINEVESPGNAEIEDEEERIYLGPGYWRKGNDYHFGGGAPVPSPPGRGSSALANTGSAGVGGSASNRISDRLTFALDEQRRYVEGLEGRLQTFADKTLSNLEGGGPVIRSGEFASIMAEIQERSFLIYQIEERLSRMADEQKEGTGAVSKKLKAEGR